MCVNEGGCWSVPDVAESYPSSCIWLMFSRRCRVMPWRYQMTVGWRLRQVRLLWSLPSRRRHTRVTMMMKLRRSLPSRQCHIYVTVTVRLRLRQVRLLWSLPSRRHTHVSMTMKLRRWIMSERSLLNQSVSWLRQTTFVQCLQRRHCHHRVIKTQLYQMTILCRQSCKRLLQFVDMITGFVMVPQTLNVKIRLLIHEGQT